MAKKTDKTLEVSGEQLQWIGKVRTFDADIHSFQSRIKTLNEQIQEEIENTDEYDAVLKAQEALTEARANLKRRLDGNSTYIGLTEDLADEKLSLKDAQDNMSEFLLGYFHETGEKQIELGPANAKEVILRGRLGKAKDFQTNIFTAPPATLSPPVSSQERKEREEA